MSIYLRGSNSNVSLRGRYRFDHVRDPDDAARHSWVGRDTLGYVVLLPVSSSICALSVYLSGMCECV